RGARCGSIRWRPFDATDRLEEAPRVAAPPAVRAGPCRGGPDPSRDVGRGGVRERGAGAGAVARGLGSGVAGRLETGHSVRDSRAAPLARVRNRGYRGYRARYRAEYD